MTGRSTFIALAILAATVVISSIKHEFVKREIKQYKLLGTKSNPCYPNKTCNVGLICYQLSKQTICEPKIAPIEGISQSENSDNHSSPPGR